MKAFIYRGPGNIALEEHEKPKLQHETDAIVRMLKTAICGTDLHILKGDVPSVAVGRVLGHEGVGIIEEVGNSVQGFKVGDTVVISCVTSCGTCKYCLKAMPSHCVNGGWILGNLIDGTQAEYVRIPLASTSLFLCPPNVPLSTLVMASDTLPTGYECGVLNGRVSPGGTVAVIGCGPVGLAALLTATLFSPIKIVAIDMDPSRLEIARTLGATATVNTAGSSNSVAELLDLTAGEGFDTVIEAVGVPATFELCQSIVAPGGVIANLGVHGVPAALHLEKLWDRNIAITTRLVDTRATPMLMSLVASGRIDPSAFVTHEIKFADGMEAYRIFGAAAANKALKVIINLD